MEMRRVILLLLLANVSSSAMAEWTVISEDSTISHYADIATFSKTGNKAKMWILEDFKTSQKVDVFEFLSVTVLSEYDCEEKTFRRLDTSAFAGNMGKGELVVNNSKTGVPMPIELGTTAENMWNIACKKMTPANMNTNSVAKVQEVGKENGAEQFVLGHNKKFNKDNIVFVNQCDVAMRFAYHSDTDDELETIYTFSLADVARFEFEPKPAIKNIEVTVKCLSGENCISLKERGRNSGSLKLLLFNTDVERQPQLSNLDGKITVCRALKEKASSRTSERRNENQSVPLWGQNPQRQLCEAQKMTCLANCPSYSYQPGVSNDNYRNCKDQCYSINCN